MIEIRGDDDRAREAQRLVGGLIRHHRPLLESGDIEARDAVIVKMVAMVALAFGIPPDDQDEFDLDDIIGKLRNALAVIEQKEKQ